MKTYKRKINNFTRLDLSSDETYEDQLEEESLSDTNKTNSSDQRIRRRIRQKETGTMTSNRITKKRKRRKQNGC